MNFLNTNYFHRDEIGCILQFIDLSDQLAIRAVDAEHRDCIDSFFLEPEKNAIEECREYSSKQTKLIRLKNKIDHFVNVFNFPPFSFVVNSFKEIIPSFKDLIESQLKIHNRYSKLELEITKMYSDRRIFRFFGGKKEFAKIPELVLQIDNTFQYQSQVRYSPISTQNMTSPIMRASFTYSKYDKELFSLILIRLKKIGTEIFCVQAYFSTPRHLSRQWYAATCGDNIPLEAIIDAVNSIKMDPSRFLPVFENSNCISGVEQASGNRKRVVMPAYSLLRELIIDKKAHSYSSGGIVEDKIKYTVE